MAAQDACRVPFGTEDPRPQFWPACVPEGDRVALFPYPPESVLLHDDDHAGFSFRGPERPVRPDQLWEESRAVEDQVCRRAQLSDPDRSHDHLFQSIAYLFAGEPVY